MTRDREISEAIDEAYKKAGSNAYFANGFKAGVAFMEHKLVKNNVDLADVSKRYTIKYMIIGCRDIKTINYLANSEEEALGKLVLDKGDCTWLSIDDK